ncbi:MAG: SGNH/GDSL hydrolase family protein [Flammeovirgaceae bacterium]
MKSAQRLLSTLKNLIFITLPTLLILLIALELFFRFGIRASDPPNNYFDETQRLYCFDDVGETGLFTIGKFADIQTSWQINNYRWNAPIDYHPSLKQPLISIIGDSYIEAFQVDVDKNYPSLLRKLLADEYQVYSFGKSGNPFSQYLHLSRYVTQHFDPEVLVFNLVHNDFGESIQRLYPHKSYMMQLAIDQQGQIKETTPKAPLAAPQYHFWKRWLRKSAIFRYFIFNLKLTGNTSVIPKKAKTKKFEANVKVEKLKKRQDLIQKATAYLVKTIRNENPDKQIIMVLDAPRHHIYQQTLQASEVNWIHHMMDSLCVQHQVDFIDLTPVMTQDYQKNRQKFNSDLDNHWNTYGHQLVAQTLYQHLIQP